MCHSNDILMSTRAFIKKKYIFFKYNDMSLFLIIYLYKCKTYLYKEGKF